MTNVKVISYNRGKRNLKIQQNKAFRYIFHSRYLVHMLFNTADNNTRNFESTLFPLRHGRRYEQENNSANKNSGLRKRVSAYRFACRLQNFPQR
jgi:hypothetical protein